MASIRELDGAWPCVFPAQCKGLGAKGKSMHSFTERLMGQSPAVSGPVTGPYSGYSLHGAGGIQVVLPEQGMVLGRATQLSPTAVWAEPGTAVEALSHERKLRVCLDVGGTAIG